MRDLTYIGEAEPQHEKWTTALARLLIEIKDKVEAERAAPRTELADTVQNDFLNRYDKLIAETEEAVRGSPEQKSGGLTASKLLNRFIKSKIVISSLADCIELKFYPDT